MTALRVYEELRGRGFTGKYTIVKDLVRRLRPEPHRQPVVRFESGKGQQAQMDYATYEIDFTEEGRRRVNLFSYVLGYSRRQYLHFVESQDFETTIREHVRAFKHLGGVAATCLYDNMKVVVARYEGDEPIYNTRFLAFATHYGYKVWACRRRRPQTKGKVERPFHFVETNFLNGRSSVRWSISTSAGPMAGGSGRRAGASRDEASAHRPARRGTALPDPASRKTLRHGGGGLPHGQCGRDGRLPAELLLGPLAVSGAGAAAADHRRGTDRLRPGPGGARPASALAAHRDRPTERVARAPAPGRLEAARGPPADTLRRIGAGGQPLPGGLVENPSHGQGPGKPGAGALGNVPQSGPDIRLGAGGTLRGLLVAIGGAHPGGPGPAQNAAGIAGRPTAAALARDPRGPAGSAPSHRRLRTTLSLSPGATRR